MPGEVVTWTLVAANNGTAPLTGVTITDPVNSAFYATVLNATTTQGTSTISGFSVTFNIGTMAPGDTVTMTISARVRDDIHPPIDDRNVAVMHTNEDPGYTATGVVSLVSSLPSTGYPPQSSHVVASWVWLVVLSGGALLLGVLWLRR